MKKRILAVLLTLVIVVRIIPFSFTSVIAADRTLTVAEAVEWLSAQTYSWFDLDGSYGAQCSDFVSAYMNWLVTGDPYSGTYGVYNAYYYTTVAGWNTSRWEIIENYDAFLPSAGDIFVSNNHVGVVIENYSTTKALIVDQNARAGYGDSGTYSWVHEITWKSAGNGAYGANYFLRYKGFITHTHSYSSSVTKQPTCTATGVRTYICSCGSSYTETIAANGHSWNGGETVTSAGCTSDGVKKFTCTVCGDTYTAAISAIGHTAVIDDAVEPTCTESGVTEGSHCSVCGAIIEEQQPVSALGHEYSMTIEVMPDCVNNAIVTCVCERCGDTFTRELNDGEITEWTVTYIDGVSDSSKETKTQYQSSDKTTTTSTYSALEGWDMTGSEVQYGAWTNVGWTRTKPTESNTLRITDTKTVTDQAAYYSYSYHHYISDTYGLSSYTKYDSTYGNIEYYTAGKLTRVSRLDADGHACYYKDSTNYKNLYWDEVETYHAAVTHTEWYYQTRTATTVYSYEKWSDWSEWQDEPIVASDSVMVRTRTLYRYNLSALGHDYSEFVETVAPTCTVNGYDVYSCSRCGEETQINEVAATGHTAVIDSAVAPTCTSTGLTEGSHCSVCGTVFAVQENVEMTAHTYGADGKCTVCGAIDPNYIIDPTSPKMTVSTVTARAGDTETVDVVVENNPGINSFSLAVSYDKNAMTLDSVAVNPELGGQFLYAKKAVWISSSDSTFNGTFMTLTFTVNDDAEAGDYAVTLSYNTGDICNYNEDDIDFALLDGKITVVDYVAGDINGDGVVNNKDLTRLLKYLAGEEVETVAKALDVTGDGNVNNKDLTRLLKYLAGEDVTIN